MTELMWLDSAMVPQKIYEAVGKKIRNFREKDHQTQAQLAGQIGISRASLANIEAGRQQVLLHHIFAIAEALELDSPASLLPVDQSPVPLSFGASELPLPENGLTEKQRLEVMRLMGDGRNDNTQNDITGGK